jgi:hypothetical protein
LTALYEWQNIDKCLVKSQELLLRLSSVGPLTPSLVGDSSSCFGTGLENLIDEVDVCFVEEESMNDSKSGVNYFLLVCKLHIDIE